MSSSEPNWSAWLRKAEHDIVAIRSILAGGQVPWDVVCFHAQQAAEKLLKGFLVFHTVQPARTHDLVALLHECTMHESALAPLLEDCRLLTVLGAQARYPGDFAEPAEDDGRAALDALGRVHRLVGGCLPDERAPRGEGGRR